MLLLSLQKLSKLFLFCMIVLQQASRNCFAMPFRSIVDILELQISNKFFSVQIIQLFYQIIMHQIQNKVNHFIQPGTKKSYRKAIDYLLSIVNVLINPQQQINKRISQKNNKYQRLFSQKKEYQKQGKLRFILRKQKIENNEDRQIIDGSLYYEGEQISFIQQLNKKAHQKMNKISQNQQNKAQQNKIKYKLNRRGIQQTIQIYHQCLQKSIQIVKLQFDQLFKGKDQTKKTVIDQLSNFWTKYARIKSESKNFDDLIHLAHFILANQFLSIIHPFKYYCTMVKKRPQYAIFYEQINKNNDKK